jgi:hypothetical protein
MAAQRFTTLRESFYGPNDPDFDGCNLNYTRTEFKKRVAMFERWGWDGEDPVPDLTAAQLAEYRAFATEVAERCYRAQDAKRYRERKLKQRHSHATHLMTMIYGARP